MTHVQQFRTNVGGPLFHEEVFSKIMQILSCENNLNIYACILPYIYNTKGTQHSSSTYMYNLLKSQFICNKLQLSQVKSLLEKSESMLFSAKLHT